MGKILLFHVNVFKANQIAEICKKTGHTSIMISRQDYDKPLGALAGISGMKSNAMYSGTEFEHEMMVFSGITSESLDEFLDEYRKAGISQINRKAIITASNVMWSALKLYKELDEHIK